MLKFFLGKLGEFVSSRVVETFWSKMVDQTADNALYNINNLKNFDLTFKTLLQDLTSLSAMASDVKDQIKNQELSGRKKRKRQVEEWLVQVKSIEEEVDELKTRVESEGFYTRLEDGGNVAKLNEQVLKLVEQSRDFGELVLDVCGSSGDTFLTNGMVGEAFHENLETIMKLLESREVSSIGVCGMGGVGKTTLAKHINNRLLQRSEGSVFWVTVSQEFTVPSLQDKIARLLGVDLLDEDEVDKRATMLHRALSEVKDSVLILDDVWEHINLLKVGCFVSVGCCRLIITSRSLEVCRRIRCTKIIRVEKLRENEAWKLFNETLGDGIELGPRVREIAKSVAKLCDGLPLGIITVAGSMRGETTIHAWANALGELKESLVGQDCVGDLTVFKVLKYSFDQLNKNDESRSNEFNKFQLCLMYCSLYPEDCEIVREDLIRKFISEGLMDERKSMRAQVEQGHSILDKLVNLCLLESCVSYKDEESVKMHDLVRAMVLKICDAKYMVRAGDYPLKEMYASEEIEWKKDLEKVSMMFTCIERIEDGTSPNCPKLSTLLLCNNSSMKYIPNSFFSRMQGLCTLDLCRNFSLLMLPDSISDMTRLKSLRLEYCARLKKVPYLGKLKALRELNLSGTGIKEAPQGLEELLNLKFLSIDATRLEMLPRGVLLKFGHLQHLNLPFHIQIEEIKNLKQLEEFHGGLKNVNDFNWFIRTRVNDPCYRIRVSSNIRDHRDLLLPLLDFEGSPPRFGIEDGLGCHSNELVLRKCDLEDEKVLGKGIVYLSICECEGLSKCFVDDLTRRFNNPTSLKKLIIFKCGGIEWILRSDGQRSQITLEEIHLCGLDDVKGVVMERGKIEPFALAVQPIVFSFLKRLSIYYCNKIRKVGLPASGLPNIEVIRIEWCGEIEEIFVEDEERAASILTTALPKLTRLSLLELPRLRKVGIPVSRVPNLQVIQIEKCGEVEEIFKEDEGRAASILTTLTLPKLTSLKLQDLPRAKSISKATIICNSIKYIHITKCPRLMNKFPLHFDDLTPPPTLENIWVEREWWESLEWEINPDLPCLLQGFVVFQNC